MTHTHNNNNTHSNHNNNNQIYQHHYSPGRRTIADSRTISLLEFCWVLGSLLTDSVNDESYTWLNINIKRELQSAIVCLLGQ